MKRLLVLACALAANCAFGYASDKEDTHVITVTLEPKKVHEECLRIPAGEKRRYHWKSNSPVDFNIHYHEGDKVHYPVKRDGMRGDGGTFIAKTGEDYCWMWTARGAAAKIDGRIDPPR